MASWKLLSPLVKVLRFYAVLALAALLFQMLGLGMYLVNVWPGMREALTAAQKGLVTGALVCGLVRSVVWIQIYWKGARALSLVRDEAESAGVGERLVPVLSSLTWLLVASCALDVLFLPAYFLSGAVWPFPMTGWRLGAMEAARLFFPQAMGMAALLLAYLTSQFGRLLRERGDLKRELDLVV